MNASTIIRYWHTLRHLQPVQITGRIRFRLLKPSLPLDHLPVRREPTGSWVDPARRPSSMIGPLSFRFLNVEGEVRDAVAWNSGEREKLWLYNLHYFEDLCAENAASRRQDHLTLVSRWIAENAPASGSGWEPYPSSLRIGNWMKWSLAGNDGPPGFHDSLALQARWLSRRVEHHIQGNHLFVNAKALVFAGCWFRGAEADGWRVEGLRILEVELQRQVLGDGAHYERSPMYHALILEDILDLINVACAMPTLVPAATVGRWRAKASLMLGWLIALTHPDGQPAFFNDAAMGIAPTLAELRAYATRLEITAGPARTEVHLSGYHRAERESAVLLVDAAPVGPDDQPGHAHADTLSFELSLGAHRVIVNGGTSTYAQGPQRSRERSTAMHSTVTVDGQDSSEVWGAFRVARRARVFDVHAEIGQFADVVAASHDGYRRLPGRPVHRRSWQLSSRRLSVSDVVTGDRAHVSIARFLLHPGIAVLDDGALRLPDGTVARWTVSGGAARVTASEWSPAFGVRCPTSCIEVHLQSMPSEFVLAW